MNRNVGNGRQNFGEMIGKILQGKSFAVFLELIAEQLCYFSKNQFVVQLSKVLSDWVKLKKASFVLVNVMENLQTQDPFLRTGCIVVLRHDFGNLLSVVLIAWMFDVTFASASIINNIIGVQFNAFGW